MAPHASAITSLDNSDLEKLDIIPLHGHYARPLTNRKATNPFDALRISIVDAMIDLCYFPLTFPTANKELP